MRLLLTCFQTRHLPRSDLLPVRGRVDGIRWRANRVPGVGRNPIGISIIHDSDVHLRQAVADVDGTQTLDGEVEVLGQDQSKPSLG